jgi:hypothetical protein
MVALTDCIGNILMLSEGQPGVDNVFSLRDGMPPSKFLRRSVLPLWRHSGLEDPIVAYLECNLYPYRSFAAGTGQGGI